MHTHILTYIDTYTHVVDTEEETATATKEKATSRSTLQKEKIGFQYRYLNNRRSKVQV